MFEIVKTKIAYSTLSLVKSYSFLLSSASLSSSSPPSVDDATVGFVTLITTWLLVDDVIKFSDDVIGAIVGDSKTVS